MAICGRGLLSIAVCLFSTSLVIANTACGGLSATSPAPTLKSISLASSSGSIAVGATQQFTATATYSNGSTANVSSTATWTVAIPAVATINASGMVTGVTAGSTTVTASQNGISGSATLDVTGKSVTSISVSPAM